MIAYSVLMFVIAALFFGIAVSISRGNINLIHSYHWKHVKEVDQKAYGKSFSKGLFVLAASLILSGVAALFGETAPVVMISLGVLLVGMIIAFTVLAKTQTKYNSGF
ncbi:MAG: hypothetical protein HFF59_03270 [Lawsonibacter sp.]|jgi:hypothetical protein|uniref:hypothetical protein n=1 Tax=Lawsonibacter sp. JLR.KK007 TaxID=3114293 RepID=UPI00216E0C3C|nr:hypothetical protein [Lawsonibacter sp.]MCI8989818.1 hypothetical protein [Lawsonibacter sp.]MCI9267965.1 hypothetical protein [Lawsonibacter sp.]